MTGQAGMNADTWTILAVGVALGGLVWQMLRSLRMDMVRRFEDVDKKFEGMDKKFEGMDKKFEGMDKRFVDMDKKFEDNFRDVRSRLDRLAADHHGLSRELSELRGELRGRLDERARPAAG